MLDILHDLRLALRTLARNRAFAIVAVATLALGIGANSAIFSIVNAVLFRPLPYPSEERVVAIWETKRADSQSAAETSRWLASPDFSRWEEQQRSFDVLGGFAPTWATLTGAGEPERLNALAVTPGFFDLAGVKPPLGRVFTADENRQGTDAVVLLSHGLWQRRFRSDPSMLGRTITVDGLPHTVVGVLPANFRMPLMPSEPALVLPMEHVMQGEGSRRFAILHGAARLKPGVAVAQAQSEMDSVTARLAAENPRRNRGRGVMLVPIREDIAGDVQPALVVLLGAVGCVLLIACANVANLLLARAAARQREVGLRTVLGAGRGALARQVLAESLVLALTGGLAGVLLARWGVSAIVAVMPQGLVARTEEIALDWRVAGFALLVSLLTGTVLGLAPALHSVRWSAHGELNSILNQGGARSGGARGSRRLRIALVVSEVAVTLVLLTGAGLLINSFVRLRGVDPGFRASKLLTMHLPLDKTKYNHVQRAALADQLLQRLKPLPAVESVAFTNSLPLQERWVESRGFEIEGRPDPNAHLMFRTVTPDYFRTMGMSAVRGRTFTAADVRGKIVIVNDAAVRRFWPGLSRGSQEPLGRRIRFDGDWHEVVGVVSDTKFDGLDSETEPEAYVPYTEKSVPALALVIRTGSDPMGLVPAIRSVVRSVDADQPIEKVATMEDLISESIARPRFHTLVVSTFAGLALVLAAVGIYGVISYSVTQRTHEIGVRIALGASTGRVLLSVVGEACLMALAGVGIGLLGAFAATRVLSKFLFGVRPTDPLTFAAVSLVLTVVAIAAGYIPARRASTVDPMVALRYE